MSFFDELKRRNVIKVGIAYAVVAWLAMQFTDIILNNVQAPGWVFHVILLLLLIGFPIALIFAWAFELTADGIKKESEVDRSQSIRKETGRKLNVAIIGILAIVAVYFFWESRFDREPVDATTNAISSEAPDPEPITVEVDAIDKSVAVLPFVNMSSDPEQEYFSDGITEEIINALVKIPNLSVPARTSVFGFKGHQGDVRQIGQQLNVAYILEGSIRSQANQVRITAQLIKVDDGFHLWSETYDRQLDNIFAVQEEIAAAISQVLIGALDVGVATVPNKTVNMKAYDTYLNGKALLRERKLEAIGELERATQLDPDFAPAWASLALAYQIRGYYVSSGVEFQEKAKETARHALAMDPDNVDALDALASALRDTWHWAEAEEFFDKAVAIDPQSSELLEDIAEFLCGVGRARECLEVARRGYELDPNFAPIRRNYATALAMNGFDEDSIDIYRRIMQDMLGQLPTENGTTSQLGEGLLLSMFIGDIEMAVEILEEFEPGETFLPVQAAALKLLQGNQNNHDLDKLKAIPYTNYMSSDWYNWSLEGFMLAYAGESDYIIDAAIDLTTRDQWGHLFGAWLPSWKSARKNSRFQELLEKYKLPEYWDEAGWPDFCRRIDTNRIECD